MKNLRGHITLAREDGSVLCSSCAVAHTALRRMRGLLGRARLAPGEGLLLQPAGSVHTAFLGFPIDVVFLDRELRVVKVVADLTAWRAAFARGARAALELPAGTCSRFGLVVGERLVASS